MSTILQDIELFMEEYGLGATTFGDKAMGDRHLVRQLRAGRRLWPETEAKVRKFMAEYATPSGDARPFKKVAAA
jgi:hypothetical protein